MSGSISIIMSNEDVSCPVNYLYFRLNQEKKKPNSTVLKCRNVSFATQVGRENEIAQQQQPLQYSSQPLAISPVGLEWGWHRFVVKRGRHPCDHGGSHPSRTLESGLLSQPWQPSLRGWLQSAAVPVATWPPHRRAGRGLPSAERCSVGHGAAGAVVSCVTPLAGVLGDTHTVVPWHRRPRVTLDTEPGGRWPRCPRGQ